MSHIEIKLVADSATDMSALIAGLNAQLNGEVVVGRIAADAADHVGNDPELEKPKNAATARTRASSTVTKTSAPASASQEPTDEGKPNGAASTGADSQGGSSSDEAPAVAYTDVQAATNTLAKAKGTAAVREILSTFGVDHATKLPEEQWAAYISACNLAAGA